MTFGAQDSVLFGSVVAFSIGRLLLYRSRLRLYERHRLRFERSQPESITKGWDEMLRSRARVYSTLCLVVAAYVGLGFLFAFHHGLPGDLRQAALGAVVFSALGSFCLESYYSLNRKLMLRSPGAARAAFLASPRRGMFLEFLIAAYVFLPTMLAFVMAQNWFLLGGAAVTFLVLVARGWGYLTIGREFSAEAEAMRGAANARSDSETGQTQ